MSDWIEDPTVYARSLSVFIPMVTDGEGYWWPYYTPQPPTQEDE